MAASTKFMQAVRALNISLFLFPSEENQRAENSILIWQLPQLKGGGVKQDGKIINTNQQQFSNPCDHRRRGNHFQIINDFPVSWNCARYTPQCCCRSGRLRACFEKSNNYTSANRYEMPMGTLAPSLIHFPERICERTPITCHCVCERSCGWPSGPYISTLKLLGLTLKLLSGCFYDIIVYLLSVVLLMPRGKWSSSRYRKHFAQTASLMQCCIAAFVLYKEEQMLRPCSPLSFNWLYFT